MDKNKFICFFFEWKEESNGEVEKLIDNAIEENNLLENYSHKIFQ